jgi:hypothetical protein
MMEDSIMMWVNNEESFYNDMHGLFDRWVEAGDAWDEADARKEAAALVAHIAEAIEAKDFNEGEKYSPAKHKEAVDEMMDDFDDYRDEAIESIVKRAKNKPKPEDKVMDEGEKEHFKKYEARAQKLGIDHIRGYMPASAQRIRRALEQGDKYLNTIPIRKWDEMATMMGYRNEGWSLSEGVSLLKHVAKWHFA